ncbi:hypothetical protein AVEN_160102-1 [Araneus ventricosus]|uniref:DUF4817 domain-containing protein n=1 Tax=Araneus ventricosus TaxID=182803 RepID=A0A4Y2GFJ8_ARAVE|nr:hypothetical protein AVEN_160102-1 [Araneus ventricosus]
MALSSMQEKSYCVLEFAETSLVSVVQRHFHTKFGKEPPHRHNVVSTLNPTEHVWDVLEKHLATFRLPPSSIPELKGRGGLVVRSRLRGRRVLGWIPNSTEVSLCTEPAARKSKRCGQMSYRWRGAEFWRGVASPSVILVI